MNEDMVVCMGCKMELPKKSLVRHCAKKLLCSSAYGTILDNWKKQTAQESKRKYQQKNKEAV